MLGRSERRRENETQFHGTWKGRALRRADLNSGSCIECFSPFFSRLFYFRNINIECTNARKQAEYIFVKVVAKKIASKSDATSGSSYHLMWLLSPQCCAHIKLIRFFRIELSRRDNDQTRRFDIQFRRSLIT